MKRSLIAVGAVFFDSLFFGLASQQIYLGLSYNDQFPIRFSSNNKSHTRLLDLQLR